MSSTSDPFTPHLAMPLLAAAQAQKHVTHNEALLALDAMVQLAVLGEAKAPPQAGVAGDRWLIAAPASGAFAGHEGAVAVREEGGWRILAPRPGWILWHGALGRCLVHDGAGWRDLPVRTADMFGVNATPDAINRLAVASPAALFTHAGVDARLVVNKASAAATAAVTFQTDWSGRAEIGLCGDDALALKVSADGALWRVGARFDAATGAARFPNGVAHEPTGAPMRGLILTPGGDGVTSLYRFDVSRAPHPRVAQIASTSGDVVTLSTPVSNQFAHAFMKDVAYVRAWNVSKSPPAPVWIAAAVDASSLRVASAASLAGFAPGETLQLGDPTPSVSPSRVVALDVSPMMIRLFARAFRQTGVIAKMSVAGVGGAKAGLGLSGSGVSGSFNNIVTLSDGSINQGLALVACDTPSPLSESNLLFVREDAVTGGQIATTIVSSLAMLS